MSRRIIREYVTAAGSQTRVDREAGVIRGVKILGPTSDNGRRYTERCMREAVRKYEGRGIYVDHPSRDSRGQTRSCYDKLGWFENVQYRDTGVYGDAHVFKSHAFANTAFECAERKPDQFGMSHNVLGDERRGKDGRSTVESIEVVHSVDLVTDPATTKGLHESTNRRRNVSTKKKTLREVLARGVWRKGLRQWLEQMPEDASLDMAAPADEPMGDVEAPPEEGAAGHGKDLMMSIADLLDGTMNGHDEQVLSPKYLKDIEAIKKIIAKYTGGGADSDSADSDSDDTGDATEESRQLKRREHVRALCDSAAFIPRGPQLKALCGLDKDEEIKELIESFQASGTPRGGIQRDQKPRSAPPRSGSFGDSTDNGNGRPLFEGKQGESPEDRARRKLSFLRGYGSN